MTDKSKLLPEGELTDREILARTSELLAATRELLHGMYEMTRLIRSRTKPRSGCKTRCGAMTSLNRPCRTRLEPGEVRCARHVHQKVRAGTPDESIDRAVWEMPGRDSNAGDEVVREHEIAPATTRFVPACGAKMEGGARCTRQIVAGQFRCNLHTKTLTNPKVPVGGSRRRRHGVGS